jgi:predicted nucleic acid-binding protein
LILADTGPLVALFDPKDPFHSKTVRALEKMQDPLVSTIPVLTEAFYMLSPESQGASRLRDFVSGRGLSIWFFTAAALERAFELLEQYADHPMDFADASLVVAAEAIQTRRIFTLDRNDFETYRVKRGHRHLSFQIL